MLFTIIIIVAIVCVAFQVLGNVSAGKVRNEAMQDPLVRELLVEPIERWGKSDGSALSERKADDAMRMLESSLGPASSRTRKIYRDALNKNLHIPLAASYAYAVGMFVENPLIKPVGAGTPEAQQKVASARIFFPTLYNVATSELSPRKAEWALCVATNLLDYFLDADEVRARLS